MAKQASTAALGAALHAGATLAAVAATVAAATAPAPKGRTAPTAGKTITVLAASNPKKAGTASHARFALYATGQTVAAYTAACVAAGQKQRNATADLQWDLQRGFIALA
jgi:hypothetical protein